MAQDIQIGDLLANGSSRSHGRPGSEFYTAAGYDALAVQRRVGRIVSELRHYIGSYNRQTRPGVEDDRDEKRRSAIRGFEQKVKDNG